MNWWKVIIMRCRNKKVGLIFYFMFFLIISCQGVDNDDFKYVKGDEAVQVRNSIKGKKIVWFGDSIIEDIQGEKYIVEEVAKLTEATIYNQGYGGCRMAKQTQKGNGLMYDKMCMYKIVDYIADDMPEKWHEFKDNAYDLVVDSVDDNRSQADALSKIDFSTVDAIIISFGTNDYGATDGALIGTNSSSTGNTFKGALNKIILTLKEKYPKIQLIFTTAIFRSRYQKVNDGLNSDDYVNPQGLKLSDYNNAIKEICKLHNVSYIDMNKLSGINKSNADDLLADGLHPSEKGCIHLSKKYASLLEEYIK